MSRHLQDGHATGDELPLDWELQEKGKGKDDQVLAIAVWTFQLVSFTWFVVFSK